MQAVNFIFFFININYSVGFLFLFCFWFFFRTSFITLTEINNEAHYVAKKTKKSKKKPSQNCSDWIRTLSVNLQGLRNSNYTITAMVQ
jgi:hypothetical protein